MVENILVDGLMGNNMGKGLSLLPMGRKSKVNGKMEFVKGGLFSIMTLKWMILRINL